MKILMVGEFMPYAFLGWLARRAITLGNQLIELGHSVDILGNGNLMPSICGESCSTGVQEGICHSKGVVLEAYRK